MTENREPILVWVLPERISAGNSVSFLPIFSDLQDAFQYSGNCYVRPPFKGVVVKLLHTKHRISRISFRFLRSRWIFVVAPGSKQWTLIILVYLYNTCAISVFLVAFCESSYMLSMQLMIEMLNAFNCSKTTDTHYKGFGAGVFTGQGNYLDFVWQKAEFLDVQSFPTFSHWGKIPHYIHKNHILKISFLIKFTFFKVSFLTKFTFFKVSFLTKFTFFKHQILGNIWKKGWFLPQCDFCSFEPNLKY